jgi:hypothetical protein
MSADLSILYRGPLSSCNYDCGYCPFAKRHETAAELAADRDALERFLRWVAGCRKRTLGLFFTPWGEALVRRWYQEALVRLTHLDHVVRVAVQTNLSCPLDWLDGCRTDRLGLWCTFHPSQTTLDAFLPQCAELRRRGVRHSVGMVGLPDDFPIIQSLRAALPAETYLWINAWDTGDGVKYRYSPGQVVFLESIDPLFQYNLPDHASRGHACRTGSSVISVDGEGTVRRCHFVQAVLGNLYDTPLDEMLHTAPCPLATCSCHIGYVHLERLNMDRIFGGERTFLHVLQGHCNSPIAGYATHINGELTLQGAVFSTDGKTMLQATETVGALEPADLGTAVALALIKEGARELISSIDY